MKSLLLLIISLLLFTAKPIQAASIKYDLSHIGGNSYQYNYTAINNSMSGAKMAWFSVLFDPSLYSENSLTIVTQNPPASDWDELILSSGLLVPAAYDVFALSGGIPAKSSVSGFTVQFEWLGIGLPGSQRFEVFDPTTNELIGDGMTTANAIAATPIPGALILFLSPIGIFWSVKLKNRFLLR